MSESENKRLICRLKDSVIVDLSLFEESAVITKEWVGAGSPHIVVGDSTEDYYVVLFEKKCGTLNQNTSNALCALNNLSPLVTTQAFVGSDERNSGHCLVLVNVFASEDFAKTVLTTISSSFSGDKLECSKHLTVAKQYADIYNAILLDPKVAKRKSSSSLSYDDSGNNATTPGTCEKRVKLTSNFDHLAHLSSLSPDMKPPENANEGNDQIETNFKANVPCSKNISIESLHNLRTSMSNSTPVAKSPTKTEDDNSLDPIKISKSVTNIQSSSENKTSTSELVSNPQEASMLSTTCTINGSGKGCSTTELSRNLGSISSQLSPKMLVENMSDMPGSLSTQSDTLVKEINPEKTHKDAKESNNQIETNFKANVPCSKNISIDSLHNLSTSMSNSTPVAKSPTTTEDDNSLDPTKISKSNIQSSSEIKTSTTSELVSNPQKASIISTTCTINGSGKGCSTTELSRNLGSFSSHLSPRMLVENMSDVSGSLSTQSDTLVEKINTDVDNSLLLSDTNINARSIKLENIEQSSSVVNPLKIGFQNIRPNMSDLPEHIKQRLRVIESERNSFDTTAGHLDRDGLPSLNDERGAGNICNFLLNKDSGSRTTDARNKEIDLLDSPAAVLAATQSSLDQSLNRNIVDIDDDLSLPNNLDGDVVENRPVVIFKDAVDELFDNLSEYPKNVEKDACPMIECSLLSHQKVALNWMIARENNSELSPFWECITPNKDYFNLVTYQRVSEKPHTVNGGILADDMGLGKTLTTIALILTNHHGNTLNYQKKCLPTEASEICQVPLLKKKKSKAKSSEKNEVSKPGFMFRQLYLNNIAKKKKKKDKKEKKIEPDQSLFSDDEEGPVNKKTKSIINDISADLDKDGPSKPIITTEEIRKTTLIVCPMSVLSNWTEQIEQHVNPSANLQVYSYYGPERVRELYYLKRFDIIITTYGTLTCDYRNENKNGNVAPLHQMKWLRIVLDEGHIIRNPRSQQHLAALSLNSSRRWILSGTAIQNRMTDLWSMLKFLRLEPFSERSWWNANVIKSLDRRRRRDGKICFNRIQKLVRHIAIRRLKSDKVNGQPLVKLPKRDVILKYVTFTEEEQTVYDQMQNDGKFAVKRYLHLNTLFKNYANILVIIMRLRQLCCHPLLCAKAVKKLDQAKHIMENLMEEMEDNASLSADLNDKIDSINEEDRSRLITQVLTFLSSSDSEECSICLEVLKDPVITYCAHIFCNTCINEVIESSNGDTVCPLCRSDIDDNKLLKIPETKTEVEKENSPLVLEKANKSIDDDEWKSSSKVHSLMECLNDIRKEDPDVKSLIVSQFTSFLDIVEAPLTQGGYQFCRLDGTMNQDERVRAMNEFKGTDHTSPTIMLLSLTAGGVGLNLVSASRVFLLDPAWNPAVEEQCFDRCHRLGQKRDVKIYKFIVRDSVEERMLILQEKKRKLMEKAFGGGVKMNAEERRRAALRDISTLLNMNLNINNVLPPPNYIL